MKPFVQALLEIAFYAQFIGCTDYGIGFGSIGNARAATTRSVFAGLRYTGSSATFVQFANEFVKWLDNSDAYGSQSIAQEAKDVFTALLRWVFRVLARTIRARARRTGGAASLAVPRTQHSQRTNRSARFR
jgi:hypothetical protein